MLGFYQDYPKPQGPEMLKSDTRGRGSHRTPTKAMAEKPSGTAARGI